MFPWDCWAACLSCKRHKEQQMPKFWRARCGMVTIDCLKGRYAYWWLYWVIIFCKKQEYRHKYCPNKLISTQYIDKYTDYHKKPSCNPVKGEDQKWNPLKQNPRIPLVKGGAKVNYLAYQKQYWPNDKHDKMKLNCWHLLSLLTTKAFWIFSLQNFKSFPMVLQFYCNIYISLNKREHIHERYKATIHHA